MAFTEALAKTLKFEGGFSNDPRDAGGETMYGITRRTAAENGYTGDMKSIPMPLVEDIYRRRYWEGLDVIDKVNPQIANYVFDIGVNRGPVVSRRMLQTAINKLLPQGQKLSEDGAIGPKTVEALQKMSKLQQGAVATILAVLHAQGYLDIVERRPDQAVFLVGWLRRVGV